MRSNYIAYKRGRFISDPGDPNHALYCSVVQKDGTIQLECTGYENTDDIINEQAKSCTLEALLTRFSNGDLSALNKFEGLYLDLTEMPQNRIDAMQHLLNAEHGFDRLPKEIRQKYDNNWRVWLAQAGEESWFADLGIKNDDDVKKVKIDDVKEVKIDEQEQ